MKKLITTVVAASILVGTTANAVAAPVIDRDAATVSEAEGLEGGSLLIVLLIAAAIAAGIILIEKSEDPDSLPTSP